MLILAQHASRDDPYYVSADYPYACQVVTMTALLSIITLPLMILAASYMGI